jgi:MarR family transcriptional regulator, organic hydroperoxide resistance regulator
MGRTKTPGTGKAVGANEAEGLNDLLCFSVYTTSHAFTRMYQPLLREFNLTYPQFITLIALWERDSQTVSELGEKLFLQSNTLTPMLKRLASLRYIVRTRDLADERQVRITLTDTGRKLERRAAEVIRNVRVGTGLDDAKASELVDELKRLRSSLEAYASHDGPSALELT